MSVRRLQKTCAPFLLCLKKAAYERRPIGSIAPHPTAGLLLHLREQNQACLYSVKPKGMFAVDADVLDGSLQSTASIPLLETITVAEYQHNLVILIAATIPVVKL